MEISPQLAQEIVSNMQEILNQELNYIKTDGTIIASTDPSRISTFHEGSTIVARTRKQLIITHDEQYQGVRKGINLPVFFEDEIIGVIGITGEKDALLHYGKILQKMTELLVKEAYIKEMDFQKVNNERLLVENILSYNESTTLNTSKITSFNPLLSRIIIVGKFKEKETLSQIQPHLNDFRLKGLVELHTVLDKEIILFLKNDEKLINIVHHTLDYINSTLTECITWGIGTDCHSYYEIQDSYHNAKVAITWGDKIGKTSISFYKKEPLSIILSEISKTKVDYFLSLLFKEMTSDEIIKIEELIDMYGINNRSITQCSNALFIHKNTLQYKLKKISKITGYDPRNIDDYFTLKIGLLLYKLYQ